MTDCWLMNKSLKNSKIVKAFFSSFRNHQLWSDSVATSHYEALTYPRPRCRSGVCPSIGPCLGAGLTESHLSPNASAVSDHVMGRLTLFIVIITKKIEVCYLMCLGIQVCEHFAMLSLYWSGSPLGSSFSLEKDPHSSEVNLCGMLTHLSTV